VSAFRPHCRFKTTLPNAEAAKPTGLSVSTILIEMLREAGYAVSTLADLKSRGREFSVTRDGRKVLLRVSGVDEFHLQTRAAPKLSDMLGLTANDDELHAGLLVALNERLQDDPRFLNVRWLFEEEVGADAVGAIGPAYRNSVYFKTTLPDDMVESNDGQILQFPGFDVSTALMEILRDTGRSVSELENLEHRGWEFETEGNGQTIVFRVTEIEEFLVITHAPSGSFGGRTEPSRGNQKFHIEMLTELNQRLQKDPRFFDLRWVFEWEIETDAAGAATPTS
jgi:hypothetical protein